MELYAHPDRSRRCVVLNTEKSPHMGRIIRESAYRESAVYDPALRGYVMDLVTWAALRRSLLRPLDLPPQPPPPAAATAPAGPPPVPPIDEPAPRVAAAVAGAEGPATPPANAPWKRRRCTDAHTQTEAPCEVLDRETQTVRSESPPPAATAAAVERSPSPPPSRSRRSTTPSRKGTASEASGRYPMPMESQLLSRPMVRLSDRNVNDIEPADHAEDDHESMLSGTRRFFRR